MCTIAFRDRGGESFLVVGCAKSLRFHPRRHKGCSLLTYRVTVSPSAAGGGEEEGEGGEGGGCVQLSLLHETLVEDAPLALCEMSSEGLLLAGIGNTLRLYSMGIKRLLRKCERVGFPSMIRTLDCHRNRVVVGDIRDSFHFVTYRRGENTLTCFADDTVPRYG